MHENNFFHGVFARLRTVAVIYLAFIKFPRKIKFRSQILYAFTVPSPAGGKENGEIFYGPIFLLYRATQFEKILEI